jgi:hypothetical protein
LGAAVYPDRACFDCFGTAFTSNRSTRRGDVRRRMVSLALGLFYRSRSSNDVGQRTIDNSGGENELRYLNPYERADLIRMSASNASRGRDNSIALP